MTTTRTPAHTAATASTPRNTVSPQDVAETHPSGTWQQEAYQDGRGTSAYGASTYGTHGFDVSQYGAASVTTQPNLQAASAITVSPQVGTGRRRRIVMRILFAFTVLIFALGFSWFDDAFQTGTERLVWTLSTCGAALVTAFACLSFGASRLRGEGSPGNRRKRQGPSFFAGPIGLALALYAVSYGVPALHDLVSGPQPKRSFPAWSIARRQPSTSLAVAQRPSKRTTSR